MSLKKVFYLAAKDVTMELRSKETISAMVIFNLLVIAIFAFAFIQPAGKMSPEVFPGLIWVTVSFAGVLGLNRSFSGEKINDCLMGLLLAPMDKTLIYFGKVIAQLVFLFLVEAISLPLFFVFLNFKMVGFFLYFLLILFLGTVGFAAAGVFLAALSSNTRTGEILLPVILFPILIPLFLGAVKATGIVFGGSLVDPRWAGAFWTWVRLMGVYDVIIFAVSFVLFDYVLEV